MRNILLVSSLFAVSAMSLYACSSDNGNNTTTDAGADVVTPPKDGGGKDAADSAPPNKDISGTTEISITVVSNEFGYPTSGSDKGKPVANAEVRIENADGSGWLEATADTTGKATFKVDLAKGPFDLTAAEGTHGAASIVGIKAAADVAGKQLWLPSTLATKEYNITGAISNPVDAKDSIQLDAAWFATVWKTNTGSAIANYSTKHVWVEADQAPLNVAALEIDANNNIVKGVWTPTQTRTNGPMVADVDFSKGSTAVTKATISIELPSTGTLTGAMIDTVGDLTGAPGLGKWSNSTVAKSVGQSAAYVGVGILSVPVANVATYKVQYLGGDLQPDYATAFMTKKNSGRGLTVHVKKADLTDGKKLTIPASPTLDVTDATGAGVGGNDAGAGPTDLADSYFTVDGSTSDYTSVTISDAQSGDDIWHVYVIGKSATKKSVPHLPSKVAFSDLSGAANVALFVGAGKGGTQATDFVGGVGGGTPTDYSFSYGVGIGSSGR